MSNQVYRNDTITGKYYDYPGINLYTMSANSPEVPIGTSINVNYNTPAPAAYNDPDMITSVSGIFHVNRPGMYSIMPVVSFLPFLTVSPTPISIQVSLLLDRPGQFSALTLQSNDSRYLNGGGLHPFSISLSACVYLNIGDIIRVNAENTSAASAETFQVLSGTSSIAINKIS